MGNCIPSRKMIIQSTIRTENDSPKSIYIEKENCKKKRIRISRTCWLNILNYMQFNELKEIGKVNRQFNSLAKSSDILLKFFQNNKEKSYESYISYCNDFSTYIRQNSFCEFTNINHN